MAYKAQKDRFLGGWNYRDHYIEKNLVTNKWQICKYWRDNIGLHLDIGNPVAEASTLKEAKAIVDFRCK